MNTTIRRVFLTGGCVALLGLQSALMAAPMGPYLTVDAGLNLAEDIDAELSAGPVTLEGEAEFDPGVRLGVAGGYNFNEWLGAELETGFIINSFDETDSWFGHVPLLANAIFRWETDVGLVPFVGVGAGGAWSILDIDEAESDSDFVFALQGQAGLRFAVSDTMSIGVVYKYFRAESPEFEIEGVNIEQDESHNHGILASFNFSF